ncbi:MAG: hypothetical protein JRI96_14415 [Deltaproteobacteria bacterium]|nr:hypothetical protein [Deltaproteobacteria bacterium]
MLNKKISQELIHYFPPNPHRIGDNLLTFDIALQLSHAKRKLIYYASQTVVEVLKRFDTRSIQYFTVPDLEHAVKLAKKIRPKAITYDLQQLNHYNHKPHLRRFFDDNIHPRAKQNWYHPETIKKWGLLRFSDTFRQMIDLPRINLNRPHLRINKRDASQLLLFPHCQTPSQQLDFWGDIADLAVGRFRTGVVGKSIVKQLASWPAGINFYCDLSGDELVDIIGNASICIGGANGLSHIAAELELPLLMIWGFNDSAIFKPIRNKTVTIIAAEENFGRMKTFSLRILNAISCFLSLPKLKDS